jgi:hydroxymethylpyrimidine pyrophosphatase-like HAD family hydrolase
MSVSGGLCVLATDYDGTLAEEGGVASATIAALESLQESGSRILLVTGRELPQLLEIFDRTDLFDWIVAENGALLYHPGTRAKRLLSEPVPQVLVDELERRGVPISTGDAIVATWRSQEGVVREAIGELGLDVRISLNKNAVMVLPRGVDKASGMDAALKKLKLRWENVVGIGDAENDLAFLRKCRCSVAVANALEPVKAETDFTTEAARGEGVVELIAEMLRGGIKGRCGARREAQLAVVSNSS